MSRIANCLLDAPGDVASLAGAIDPPTGIFRVKLAVDAWERHGYARLRHEVFCGEQGLFGDTDRDEVDAMASAQAIVAVSYAAVMDDEVVGTVRIHERSPGVWVGSRLAIAAGWRGVPNLAAALVRCAVTTARQRGCERFVATVQRQNVPLFRRLHWRSVAEVQFCGKPHHAMEAELAHYPVAAVDARVAS